MERLALAGLETMREVLGSLRGDSMWSSARGRVRMVHDCGRPISLPLDCGQGGTLRETRDRLSSFACAYVCALLHLPVPFSCSHGLHMHVGVDTAKRYKLYAMRYIARPYLPKLALYADPYMHAGL
jgi:hypothetical protein